MIIPDDNHDKPQTNPTPKRHRGSDVFNGEISDQYQQKVNDALIKMTDGQSIRINRVCKPRNREMFIEAIKRFITSQPYGGGISFTSDWESFYKSDVSWIDGTDRSDDFDKERANEIATQRKRRSTVFRFWRQTLKHETIIPFCHNSAEYAITDPRGTIESGLVALRSSQIGTATFNAWLLRMESLANAWQQHNNKTETFDAHNRVTVFDQQITTPIKWK